MLSQGYAVIPSDIAPPTVPQRMAFAYAAKPFALLSFLSSLWIIYSLLLRCHIQTRSMYHRLILSAAICISVLSFCLFWGTWAAPTGGNPYIIGASGNDNTCTAQGFLFDWAYIAFPFYYASFSVLALVSVKNNFKEERYAWMEKWIHLGAYVPPFIFVLVSAAHGWIKPGYGLCSYRFYPTAGNPHPNETWHIVLFSVQLAELLVATGTILYLWFNFNKIQKSIDSAIGMKKIREKARKQRTRDVAIQSALYLLSFWFMYITNIASLAIYFFSDRMPYSALILANVITGTQGLVLLFVYFGVRQKDFDEKQLPTREYVHSNENETVSKIRANAADGTVQRPRLSLLQPTSFRIFDGTPAEDSPWAAYFDDDSAIESIDEEDLNTQGTSGRSIDGEDGDLSASLLT